MLIIVEYNGDDLQERDFHFVSKDFSRLPSITVKILQKKFKYYNCTIETFICFLKFMSFVMEDENLSIKFVSQGNSNLISINELEKTMIKMLRSWKIWFLT